MNYNCRAKQEVERGGYVPYTALLQMEISVTDHTVYELIRDRIAQLELHNAQIKCVPLAAIAIMRVRYMFT